MPNRRNLAFQRRQATARSVGQPWAGDSLRVPLFQLVAQMGFGRRHLGLRPLNALSGSCADDCSFAQCPFSDRKSTRLNSSHPSISYAVFCLKKKSKITTVND